MFFRSVLQHGCLGQHGMCYNTDTQPNFLEIWLNFSSTQTYFQFLNVSIDLKTQPSICFKTHGQNFQTLSWAFQTFSQAFQTFDRIFAALRENQKFGRKFQKVGCVFKEPGYIFVLYNGSCCWINNITNSISNNI